MTDPLRLIGESVTVMPEIGDDFNEFIGTVIAYDSEINLYTVEDQDGDCFKVGKWQMEMVEFNR